MGYITDRLVEMKSEQGKVVWKNAFYGSIYEEWLERFKGKEVVLMEVGTGRGGSLQVWKSYLGPKSMIYGVDYHGDLFYEEDQIKHFLADQGNRASLEAIPVKELDVLIDDGSHMNSHQINTFEVLFPRIKSGGLYIIEDVGCSYRKDYDGGYRKQGTLIEYCKDIIENLQINEWTELIPKDAHNKWLASNVLPYNPAFGNIGSIVFYTGMIIIRKA